MHEQPSRAARVAWAAGFLEGEGSLDLGKNGRTRLDGTKGICIRLRARQNHPQPLHWLVDIFGGKVYGPYPRANGGNSSWVWNVAGKRAKEIIEEIWPWLSDRRQEQWSAALDRWEARFVRAA